MRSARRKRFIDRKTAAARSQNRARFKPYLFVLIPVLILLLIFAFIKITTRFWNGHDKVSFAFPVAGGDVEVVVLDPKLSEQTTFIIPGDTEVDVAENYGTLRLKSVWPLSHNEKRAGKLLPETVTEAFWFPTFLWSDKGIDNVWSFVFSSKDTNIPFGDRVEMGIFALNVPALGKTEINLGQSQYLKKVKLSDGAMGFRLNGTPPERLTVYFSDNDLSEGNLRVNIVDSTGTGDVGDTVGQIIQVLGGKVVSIDKKALDNTDCTVIGGNKNVVRKIETLFNCKGGGGSTNFDLEIRLGSAFAKRF